MSLKPHAGQNNPPRNHHFAPEFYLKRWAGADGMLEQFSRPGGRTVKARRKHPSATGFEEDLYAIPGLRAELVQQAEQVFFQKIDTRAADVLAQLETRQLKAWTPAARTAWTVFIQSLQLRTPDDVRGIKARSAKEWERMGPEIQRQYEALRGDNHPATANEYWEKMYPNLMGQIGMAINTRLIRRSRLADHIYNMVWEVLDVSDAPFELLTSDRSVERAYGLGDKRGFISLPIGPTLLFVAANERCTIDQLLRAKPRDVVMKRNVYTVRGAAKLVWASDRTQKEFIAKHFAAATIPALGSLLDEPNGDSV